MLDHKFLEWVTGLGPEWKMRNGKLTYIFRKLAERVGVRDRWSIVRRKDSQFLSCTGCKVNSGT